MQGDIADLHLVVVDTFSPNPVVDHHVAEGAGRGDTSGPGGQQFLGAFDVDVLADVLLHEHATSPRSATHAIRPLPVSLHQVNSGQTADHVSGRRVDVVVPAQVAGVVVHHPFLQASPLHVQTALVDQPLQELAVVHHLVVPTHLRVLVSQGVEAVGALGDDLLHAHTVERLNVLRGQHLEDVLVAGPTGRVAGTHL